MLQFLILVLISGTLGRAEGALRRVCEGGSMTINCGSKMRIHILGANYGRLTGRSVCGWGPIKTTNCRAAGSLAKVRFACHGRSSCVLPATNSKFGDPCVGTYKYLEVSYKCVSPPGAFVLVCEHRSHGINCPSPKTIQILYANYGRLTGKSVCGNGPIKTTNCRAARSLAVVRSDCDGRSSCVLRATNSKFGDPCVGTYKYLEVSYKCVSQPGTLLQICEHRSHGIYCPSLKTIQILSANYGRLTSKSVCGNGPIKTTNCRAARSLAVVKSDCDGRSSCVLRATNSKFGDPCVGTYKYLEVSYKCVQQPGTLLQVCEHHSRVIVCPSSRRIKILSANYGRLTGRNVCGNGPIKTTNCRAAGSLAKVQRDCNGRSSCVLRATNSKFGDPCVGTYKYLEVRYICL